MHLSLYFLFQLVLGVLLTIFLPLSLSVKISYVPQGHILIPPSYFPGSQPFKIRVISLLCSLATISCVCLLMALYWLVNTYIHYFKCFPLSVSWYQELCVCVLFFLSHKWSSSTLNIQSLNQYLINECRRKQQYVRLSRQGTGIRAADVEQEAQTRLQLWKPVPG